MPSPHTTSGADTVDGTFASSTWKTECFSGLFPVGLGLSCPLRTVLLGGKLLWAAHTLRSRNFWSLTASRQSLCMNYLEFFCVGDSPLLPPTYSFIQSLFLSVQAQGSLLSPLGYNAILLHLFCCSNCAGLTVRHSFSTTVTVRCAFGLDFVFTPFLVLFCPRSSLLPPHALHEGQHAAMISGITAALFYFYENHTRAVRHVREFSLSFNILLYII